MQVVGSKKRDFVAALKMQEISLLPIYTKLLLITLPCVHAIGCMLNNNSNKIIMKFVALHLKW